MPLFARDLQGEAGGSTHDKKARLLVRTLGDAPGKSKETPHAHSEQSQSAPASVGGAGTSVGHGSRPGGFFARGRGWLPAGGYRSTANK